MEQQNYEREIDLIQLIKEMLKRFWIMALAGVAGAVLFGAYRVIPQVQNLNDPAVLEAQEEAYQKEMEEYTEKLEQAEKELENLQTSMDRQKEYNEKSVLMQMNPFDRYVANVQYYIDTGYQINVGNVYQNPDITKSVLNAYASVATNGTMYNYLRENMKEEMELRYLKELVSVSVDYNNYMININVIHKDEAQCWELLSLVEECFESCREEIGANIGAHEMRQVTESVYAMVDLGLEETQKSNQEKVENLAETLAEKQEAYEKMEEPERKVTTAASVIKGGIKYVLVGGVGGAFLAAAVLFFLILLDTTIKDAKDVEFYLGLPVLAEIPEESGKKKKEGGMPEDMEEEAVRILRTGLEHQGEEGKVTAFTGVTLKAGKSSTAYRTASAVAGAGKSCVYVDADFRNPSQGEAAGTAGEKNTLAAYLRGKAGVEDIISRTDREGLYVVEAGAQGREAAELLGSAAFRELVKELKEKYERVVIDAPAAGEVADGLIAAGQADGTVLVIKSGKTGYEKAQKAKKQIEMSGGTVLGAVLER